MTVYVDDWRGWARVGRTAARWSHLMVGPGDDLAELHALAARIGLRRSSFKDEPWPRAHYTVTGSKRQRAIAAGAVPISWKEATRLAWLEASRRQHEAAAVRGNCHPVSDVEPVTDLAALHDALDSAKTAAWAGENGNLDGTSLALMEASAALASAFAPGSREAHALSVILTAIGRAVSGAEQVARAPWGAAS